MEGEVPAWLRGHLVHTGPGLFELEKGGYAHWFDGLALLTSVFIASGRVSFRSRYLESEAYEQARRRGRPVFPEFDTTPPAGTLRTSVSVLRTPSQTDNANVNVAHLADAVIAMTETPRHIEFEPGSLETHGERRYTDTLRGALSTAHPQIDRGRDVLHNLLVRLGRRCHYDLYELALGSRYRRLVASLPTDRPSYVHSFGASEHYLVLTEAPLCVHPLRLRFSRRPYIERYDWLPERRTRVRVVRKSDGHVVSDVETEPFFFFHHVNAFERDGSIELDLLAYPDPAIVGELRLDRLRESPPLGTASLMRLSVPIGVAGERVVPRPIWEDGRLELPRIHPRCERRAYTRVFAVGNSDATTFFDEVIALDLDAGAAKRFRREGWFFNEPLFVPRPSSTAEDDGVLLVIALDGRERVGRLILLSAETLDLIAQARLPHVVPFHFHGQFFEM